MFSEEDLLEGKTIASVHSYDTDILFKFTDGTNYHMSAEIDEYDEFVVNLMTKVNYKPVYGCDMYKQRKLGLISDEELENFNKERREKAITRRHKQEREKYEELKKKFERS